MYPGWEAVLNVLYYGFIGLLSIIFYMYYLAKRSTTDEDQVYKSPYEGKSSGSRGKLLKVDEKHQEN